VVQRFRDDVLKAVAKECEVRLTTYGRKTGKPTTVTIWIVADGDGRVFIRSGKGFIRHWPQNLLKRPEGDLNLGKMVVPFNRRHVTDTAEARDSSKLYGPKYGPSVKPSKEDEPLTLGEQAAFELLPPGS
jgi:deazaflavin-dependent oxidoreductase (nitroreductase family)